MKLLRINLLHFVALISFSAFMMGCSSDGNNSENKDGSDSIALDEELATELNMAKQVFYSLPSPIETAMLMKRAGAKYDETILAPTENVTRFNTNLSMSLNLGVYSADLSFASMFDQSQASLKYLSTCKKLADDLGILNAISKKTIERMENNINNRDSLMEIISETFMNSNSFLKENERAETAAIILVGGWIEGLYIATQITKTTKQNNELITRIIDQRLSLATLLSLLQEYSEDQNVASLMVDLNEIEGIFEEVQVTNSKIEAVTDASANKTVIKSQTTATMDDKVFKKLCDKVQQFRTKIIS